MQNVDYRVSLSKTKEHQTPRTCRGNYLIGNSHSIQSFISVSFLILIDFTIIIMNIRVADLTRRILKTLKMKQQKAKGYTDITGSDELCMIIAALCSNLACGPYDRVFDRTMRKINRTFNASFCSSYHNKYFKISL